MMQTILSTIEPEAFANQIADAVAAKLKMAASDPAKDNLTQSEACELMNICRGTLISWQNKGIISVRKVGRRVYYSRAELLSVNLQEKGGQNEQV